MVIQVPAPKYIEIIMKDLYTQSFLFVCFSYWDSLNCKWLACGSVGKSDRHAGLMTWIQFVRTHSRRKGLTPKAVLWTPHANTSYVYNNKSFFLNLLRQSEGRQVWDMITAKMNLKTHHNWIMFLCWLALCQLGTSYSYRRGENPSWEDSFITLGCR